MDYKIKGQFHNLYGKYKIGKNTTIGSFCDIDAEIGEDCMIQAFAFIPRGVKIGNNVFIGPRVTFTNDKHPPSEELLETIVEDDAAIGAGVVILPGITIGQGSLIGAGSVVVRDVLPHTVVTGNPAKERCNNE